MTGQASDTTTWIEQVKAELGLDVNCDISAILDVARDAAHAVERPAAPITTFLLGYAVALGKDMNELTKKISALAENWPSN
jgi:hypothetical protein